MPLTGQLFLKDHSSSPTSQSYIWSRNKSEFLSNKFTQLLTLSCYTATNCSKNKHKAKINACVR